MSNRITLALTATALFLSAGATPLQAGDKVKFGGAATLALPTADLKTDTNDKVGFGAAFQVTFDLGKGHALRPRADVLVHDVKERRVSGGEDRETTELVSYGIGADYLYYFGGRTSRGLYAIAGLGVQHWNVAVTTHDWDGDSMKRYSYETSRKRTSLSGAVGLGYQVNTWFGAEVRYATAAYEGARGQTLGDSAAQTPSANRTGGAIQLAATFRW
ncbi:MAG: outer membrane beta-barrel protein [Holophagaceae bacterium]